MIYFLDVNGVNAQAGEVLPVTSGTAVVGAVAIMENADFFAPELLDYRNFYDCAFDERLTNDSFVVVANQQDIRNIITVIDFVGEFFDINQRADFSAVLVSTSANNCIHAWVSNLHLPPPLYHS